MGKSKKKRNKAYHPTRRTLNNVAPHIIAQMWTYEMDAFLDKALNKGEIEYIDNVPTFYDHAHRRYVDVNSMFDMLSAMYDIINQRQYTRRIRLDVQAPQRLKTAINSEFLISDKLAIRVMDSYRKFKLILSKLKANEQNDIMTTMRIRLAN